MTDLVGPLYVRQHEDGFGRGRYMELSREVLGKTYTQKRLILNTKHRDLDDYERAIQAERRHLEYLLSESIIRDLATQLTEKCTGWTNRT